MNWLEAKQHIKGCIGSFEKLKNCFSGEERKILEKTYVVLNFNGKGQTNLPRDMDSLLLNIDIAIVACKNNGSFLYFLKKRQEIKNKIASLESYLRYLEKRINDAIIEGKIEVSPFTVEIRFEELNFDVIQKIKQTDFCDREKTDMSKTSIRIVLKVNIENK